MEDIVAFFGYREPDQALLREIAPALEREQEALVAAFYRHLLAHPTTRRKLRDPEVVERLLDQQREYLASLAGPEIDEDYVAGRRRIGEVHEQIGLEPQWYLGAYALYLSLMTPIIHGVFASDPARAERALIALQRLLWFDAQIALSAYFRRHERDLEEANAQLAEASRALATDLEHTGVELRRSTARARAAEQLASVGTLVAGLAHEIGTPMGVIQGHAQLLEPEVQGEDARWRLRTIREQVDRIQRIMKSLLNIARPDRGRVEVVDLAALLDATLAFLSEKLRRRQIEVVKKAESGVQVHGDPERLQQVLLNLCLNAADAMAEGGTLTATLSMPSGESVAEIAISDTGSGIPEDALARIFEPFWTSKPAGEGSGLGLSVAHGIVADHGGELRVKHSGPGGTEFALTLPLHTEGRN